MVILGIDPGYAIVGYGVIEAKNSRYRPLEHGAVTTKSTQDFNGRLEVIYNSMEAILQKWKRCYFACGTKSRRFDFRIYAFASKASCNRLWTGTKTASDGNDKTVALFKPNAKAGRYL